MHGPMNVKLTEESTKSSYSLKQPKKKCEVVKMTERQNHSKSQCFSADAHGQLPVKSLKVMPVRIYI